MKKITLIICLLPFFCFSQKRNVEDSINLFSKRIIGKWQSLEEKKETWIITGNTVTIRYGSKKSIADVYRIQSDKELGYTLTIGLVDLDLLYQIDFIKPNSMSLIYVARGNFHRFKRIK